MSIKDLYRKVRSALIASVNSTKRGKQRQRKLERHLVGTDNLRNQKSQRSATILKADCRALSLNTSRAYTGRKEFTSTGLQISPTIEQDYLVCTLPTIIQRENCGSSGATRLILGSPDTIRMSTNLKRHQ